MGSATRSSTTSRRRCRIGRYRSGFDLVSGMNWEIPAGNQVLDIDGSLAASANGSIAQDIPTTPGTSYDVGFVYSGNPDCGDVGMVSMDVLWNGVVIGTVTHRTDNPGHTLADFDYQPFAASVAGRAAARSFHDARAPLEVAGPRAPAGSSSTMSSSSMRRLPSGRRSATAS